jgi:hypothetical protein
MADEMILDDEQQQKKRAAMLGGMAPSGFPQIPQASVAPPAAGIPPVSAPKIGNPHAQELDRLTNPDKESSKAGWQQIHNPILKTLAGIGNVVGSAFAPGVTSMIPGTSLHHQGLVNQQEKELNQDVGRASKQAESAQQNASAAHLNAETDQIGEPHSPSNDIELFQKDPNAYEQYLSAKEGHQADKGVANPQAGYAAAIADALKRNVNPDDDPHVKAWRGAIEATQKEPAQNRDDKAIAIQQKQALGKPLTPEEVAYKKAYDQYVKQNKTDPGVARMSVLLNGRMVPTVEEGGKTVYTPVTQAAGKESPQSIPFQTEKSVVRSFTSGPEAKTLNAFNTAHEHLQQFAQAADALQNGNVQVVNRIAQSYAQQTGSPAPTNFDSIRAAVAGEISKTFKGTGAATDDEIRQINETINRAQSPAQLKGAIATYTKLMESKRHALEQQYQQGLQGKPSFGADVNQGGGVLRYNPATGKLE